MSAHTLPPPEPVVDPVAGWLTDTRVGRDPDGAWAKWGAKPARPACGRKWLEWFRPAPARLSNGTGTDRQWCAFHFTSLLVKGFCRPDVISVALADEGVFPVLAECGGERFAMATVWLNVIRDSVCGAYHEVVLSFDVSRTRADAVAVRTTPAGAPWAVLYSNLGPSACDAQFLHSLWIDSPLSIRWGREMQGFPKHPKPVESIITDDRVSFAFDLSWDRQPVMRGAVGKRFGLVRESLGLMGNHPLGRVLGFLTAKSFDVPILMPTKTAAQNGVGRQCVGHLWKGLNPAAVQVWPWATEDTLELGEVSVPTGCEPHNGQRLLREAAFRPVSVTYLPRTAAFVEAISESPGV